MQALDILAGDITHTLPPTKRLRSSKSLARAFPRVCKPLHIWSSRPHTMEYQ